MGITLKYVIYVYIMLWCQHTWAVTWINGIREEHIDIYWITNKNTLKQMSCQEHFSRASFWCCLYIKKNKSTEGRVKKQQYYTPWNISQSYPLKFSGCKMKCPLNMVPFRGGHLFLIVWWLDDASHGLVWAVQLPIMEIEGVHLSHCHHPPRK